MGGQREDIIESESTSKMGEGGVIQEHTQLRFHENAGEVHFHDDKKGIKAAIPVATWYAAWEQISTMRLNDWLYFDKKNSTLFKIQLREKDFGHFECVVYLNLASHGPVFLALDKFTRGK